jgi:hypothetical protein
VAPFGPLIWILSSTFRLLVKLTVSELLAGTTVDFTASANVSFKLNPSRAIPPKSESAATLPLAHRLHGSVQPRKLVGVMVPVRLAVPKAQPCQQPLVPGAVT